jgi:hypothetical protein
MIEESPPDIGQDGQCHWTSFMNYVVQIFGSQV